MNVPNALTLLRVFMVPAFVLAVVDERFALALALFGVAAVTDGLDGFIATRFNQCTEVGAYLDPVADKILLVAGYLVLTWKGHVGFWLTTLVVSRDILIVGGAILYQMVTNALRMEPLWISKVNTLVQLIYLGCVLLAINYGWPSEESITLAAWLVALTTVSSGVSYVLEWTRRATAGKF